MKDPPNVVSHESAECYEELLQEIANHLLHPGNVLKQNYSHLSASSGCRLHGLCDVNPVDPAH